MRNIRSCSCAVIGGAGFLGSHMVNHLVLDRGCRVLVVDNLCAGRREFIHPQAEFVHADITTSESFLYRLFTTHKISYVMNYAAWPYIPDSFDRPSHVCGVNFTGALNVINAAADAECLGVLQVSSAEIYGEGTRHDPQDGGSGKIDEFDDVVPHSTYGAAKAAIDFLVQARWKEAGVPCIALRQFNCVGERETHPYVIPEIITQLYHGPRDKNGTTVIRLGNNSRRDFLYAGDAVRMACELLERGQFGDVYNLGSESSVAVYDLPQMVADAAGAGRVAVQEDKTRKRPWEIWHLCSDNSKTYKTIESRPQVPLSEALERTVKDYLSNGRRWCWEK